MLRTAVLWMLLCAGLLPTGCTPPASRAYLRDDDDQMAKQPVWDAKTYANDGAAAEGTPTSDSKSDAGPVESLEPAAPALADMTQILSELQQIGAVDATTQNQLIEDLKHTDPALWPQLVQTFRATLAYRQQLAAKVTVELAPDVAEPSVAAAAPPDGSFGQVLLPELTVPDQLITDWQAGLAPVAIARASCREVKVAAEPPVLPEAAEPLEPQPSWAAGAEGMQASHDAPLDSSAATWEQQLAETIKLLEKETAANPTTATETAKQAYLRMLYLTAGRRDDAVRAIPGLTPAEQEFWSKQLFGLSACLDVKGDQDSGRRASQALLHIREAASRLGETASLVVRNLHFCTEVSSYGVFKKFESDVFTPGQEVLLYAEIENFSSRQTEKGFHTSLKSSYQLLDSRGARVAIQDFEPAEEYCRNLRRDFFIRYFVWMPKRIDPGPYTLQLTVEDTGGQKVGQSSLAFTIREN